MPETSFPPLPVRRRREAVDGAASSRPADRSEAEAYFHEKAPRVNSTSPIHRVKGLYASPRVCWYDWSLQTASMERLLDFDFEWVLPGHGRRHQAISSVVMRREIERVIARMRGRH